MTASPEPQKTGPGPACYRNWHAQAAGAQLYLESEFPLYSDAKLSLQEGPAVQLGPYVLVHAHPQRTLDPALVLVVLQHLDPQIYPDKIESNQSGFTGTWPADEMAALLSLLTGARLVSGGPSREVQGGIITISGDRRRPTGFWDSRPFMRAIPQAAAPKEIDLSRLLTLPNVPADEATALVRAARCYRDGLWVAESQPDLTWLLFVSALEVAAVQQHIEQTKPVDVLQASKAKFDLVQKLRAAGGEELVEFVAGTLHEELRATGRFLDFMDRFMPPAPEKRPPEGFRLDWSDKKRLKKFMSKVYEHRSKALHAGIPFPAPMCMGPMPSKSSWEAPPETVLGVGAHMLNGMWDRSEMPFPLHTFEHITRGALLKWWDAFAEKAQPNAGDVGPCDTGVSAPAAAAQ